MAAGTVVKSDIDAGLNLIRALDETGFGASAALWWYYGDLEDWKLVIAYRGEKKDLEKKYLEAARASARWRSEHPDEPILDLNRVWITSADDQLIKGLKPALSLEGLGEVRFTSNMINGIYVEDAIIHRLAA